MTQITQVGHHLHGTFVVVVIHIRDTAALRGPSAKGNHRDAKFMDGVQQFIVPFIRRDDESFKTHLPGLLKEIQQFLSTALHIAVKNLIAVFLKQLFSTGSVLREKGVFDIRNGQADDPCFFLRQHPGGIAGHKIQLLNGIKDFIGGFFTDIGITIQYPRYCGDRYATKLGDIPDGNAHDILLY